MWIRIYFLLVHLILTVNLGCRDWAHTLGFSHCNQFSNRIYSNPIDPTLNSAYASRLQGMCPRNVDFTIVINMDPTTPRKFDNVYNQNLKNGKGLFISDQVLYRQSKSMREHGRGSIEQGDDEGVNHAGVADHGRGSIGSST
ncbi:hypothetical protein SUGI_0137130 [Cryptomeria japonica]|nr:hypothetical protein SUGI_0137130 [Cryptomeria japonica]